MRDTEPALTVLRDPLFNSGTSAFFGDLLPTRDAQTAVGRAVRNAVRDRLPDCRAQLAEAAARLPADTRWPDAGPMLVYRGTADLLLHPEAPYALRQLLEHSVTAGLLVRPQRIRQRVRVEALRPRLFAALAAHVRDRREEGLRGGGPRDMLDAVLGACPPEATDRTVVELYVLLFRSVVGNIGYTVAWTLLLAGLHSTRGAPPPWPADWTVREAARHRPFVWMVGRPVPHALEVGGVPFESGTVLSVSPYLLHHDADRWPRPDAFEPERWERPDRCGPCLPFSTGPFTCAGAAVAHSLATEAVAQLTTGALVTVSDGDPRPLVTNAAVPRPFTLHRGTHRRVKAHTPGRR
ncbi:cytochrome P450 [Streptomyces iconiensis]|uniref:Cytochrome P450 n=1 Tax=Streptomyces iconiensis TaxID=1384038 RepID=A0ABT6ZQE1_9ACTN|nr:cytochrome P450 [Streptomyces iconiensis]MDJ1130753.1 cytochrome P450 [Streptomyces iconiensis]